METLGKIVIEGLKLIDPTIKGIDLIQALSEFAHKKNIEKMDRINEKLLKDEATEYEKNQILSGGINTEDYLSFIRAAVNDDEAQKETIYITLYRNILNGKIKDGKGRLFNILKQLPYSAIELLPKIYVYRHNNAKNLTCQKYLENIIHNDNLAFELNLLIQFGFIKNKQLGQQVISNGINIEVSSSFDSIVNVFFKEEELTPKYNNIPIWNKNVHILADIQENSFAYIQDILTQYSIKPSNSNILAVKEYKPFYNTDTIICIQNNKEIPEKVKNIIQRYSNSYKIHKVCFQENIKDQLLDIERTLMYIEKNNKEHIESFISQLDIHPLNLF